MVTTKNWAKGKAVSTAAIVPPVKGFDKPFARSAREIAVRTLVLQGVVAVACGVEPKPVIAWFRDQGLWKEVSPDERRFLRARSPAEKQRFKLQWHMEAEWALLWTIRKVESLGLPTRQCDSRRLVDEIMPGLGDGVEEFIRSSVLRLPAALLAEDDRTYNLWCYANIAKTKGEPLPADLDLGVLYERRYAFEWLDGNQDWDDVTCDS